MSVCCLPYLACLSPLLPRRSAVAASPPYATDRVSAPVLSRSLRQLLVWTAAAREGSARARVRCRTGRRAECTGGSHQTHTNGDDEGPRWRRCAQCVCAARLALPVSVVCCLGAWRWLHPHHTPLTACLPLAYLTLPVSCLRGPRQQGRGVIERGVLCRAGRRAECTGGSQHTHTNGDGRRPTMAAVHTVRVSCLPCLSQLSAASALGGGCIPTIHHRPLACPWLLSLPSSAACMDCSSKGGECRCAVSCWSSC